MAKTEEVRDLSAKQWECLDRWCRANREFIESAETQQEVFDKALKKSKCEITGKRQNECKCGVAQPEHIIEMCAAQRIALPEK